MSAYVVSPAGTCELLPAGEYAAYRSKALRRAANANAVKHYWCGRRSPASFPWGAVMVGEAD